MVLEFINFLKFLSFLEVNKLKDKNIKNRGFTLVEVIISITILIVLATAVFSVSRFSDTHKDLTLAKSELEATIRFAQISAVSVPVADKDHVCGFGVYFDSSGMKYDVFYNFVDEGVYRANPDVCLEDSSYRIYDPGRSVFVSDESHQLFDKLQLDPDDRGKAIFFSTPYGQFCDNNGDFFDLSDFEEIKIVKKEDDSISRSVIITGAGRVE